jgi:hypothetical protein
MNEKIKALGGQTEGMICSQCYQIIEENSLRMIEGQVICDDCDIEPSLQKPVKENIKKIINELDTVSILANASKETSPKAIQILNIEELNSQIIIPPELNIIDCPEMVNSDINWFRNNFKNFWRLFTSKAEWVFIIHDRGTGKSKQTALHELYQIAINKDYEGCFIMRNREEPTRQTKEYFSKIILEFTETIWLGNRTVKDKFHLQWNSIWKGVQYKANPSDKKGDLRCHFLDLYSPEQARTLINKPIQTIFFDECIPTRNQIKEGKGWKLDEPGKYMEAVKSLGRLTKPKKIFTGNPNDTWQRCWMIKVHFKKELEELESWYWKNKPTNFADFLNWTWTKELQKGNKVLQLKKIARQKEDFATYEDDNWDNFFQSKENLRIIDHKNSAEPLWVFNDCVLYSSKQNYFYFIPFNSKEISQRDKELIGNLPEYCINPEQRMRSQQRIKRDRTPAELRTKLLRWYESQQLFFADEIAKQLIEEFIAKRHTQSEF